MNTNQRLRLIREATKLKQKDFAENLGLKQATYSRYETGDVDIPNRLLEVISTRLQINLN